MRKSLSSIRTTTEDTERLIGLSDALFGIAITFLALDLADVPENLTTSTSVWRFLSDASSNYYTYAFCFLVVGYQWWRHHWMFRYIKRRSRVLVLLTFLLLALVALLPYPVSIAARALDNGAAILTFTLPVIAIGLVMWGTFEYALASGLTIPDMPPGVVANARATLLESPVVFMLSSAVAAAAIWLDSKVVAGLAVGTWALLAVVPWIANRFWPPPRGVVEVELETEEDEDEEQSEIRSTFERLRHGSDTDRLVVFNDGVYAIAATILALQFRAPTSGPITASAIGDSLGAQQWWPYFLTFYMLSTFWIVHLRLFEQIKAVDTTLLWLNLLHLMFVAFLPVAVELTGIAENTVPAELLYFFVLLLVSLSTTLMGGYARRNGRLVPRQDRETELYQRFRGLIPIGIFALAMGVTVVSPQPAYANYVLLLFIFEHRILGAVFPNAAQAAQD